VNAAFPRLSGISGVVLRRNCARSAMQADHTLRQLFQFRVNPHAGNRRSSMFGILRSIDRKLGFIAALLKTLLREGRQMSQATDNLATAVQRETSVVSSVTALISGLAAQIRATSTDPQGSEGKGVMGNVPCLHLPCLAGVRSSRLRCCNRTLG